MKLVLLNFLNGLFVSDRSASGHTLAASSVRSTAHRRKYQLYDQKSFFQNGLDDAID
jgi:hypothetical protein